MEYIGIGLVSFCCIMFIHLGLGDTLCKIIHYDFILFRCQKCLNFWAVLAYSIFIVHLSILVSLALAFAFSYNALWVDLGLSKIAGRYDYWFEQANKNMGGEQDSKDSGKSEAHSKDNKEKKVKNRILS